MYCSKCGNVISDKLNYCNICGGKLTNDTDNSHEPILNSLIISITLISLVGLGCVIGLVAMLLGNGVAQPTIVFLAIFFLLALLGIVFTVGKQISKLIDSKLVKNTQTNDIILPHQLSAPTTAQLEEPKKQPFSVTDNTTRTLDEVFVKRN